MAWITRDFLKEIKGVVEVAHERMDQNPTEEGVKEYENLGNILHKIEALLAI